MREIVGFNSAIGSKQCPGKASNYYTVYKSIVHAQIPSRIHLRANEKAAAVADRRWAVNFADFAGSR
jgi:hypothetical protein